MRFPLNIRVLAFGAGLVFAGQALAQLDCLKAPDPAAAPAVRVHINLKRAQQCYDVKAHTPASLEPAVKLLDQANKDQARAERKRTVAGLLQLVSEWTQSNVRDAALRDPLQVRLAEARAAISASDIAKEVSNPTAWRIVERPRDGALVSSVSGAGGDLAAPIGNRCPEAQACRPAIADVEAVLRSHALVEAALVVLRKDELADFADLFAKRAAMWDAYRTEARPQYPWEWLLNGVLYRDDRPTDAANNPLGPASLPKGQWIVLHPGVGVERFEIRNTDNSASNPTLYVEWLGYNRLNWDYEAGRLRGGLGVSLVSVYASRHDAKDWSHGVMFWAANKYGLAATRNSEGTSLMISVDVGELFRDQLNRINQLIPGAGTR
jgi:hypothetical protein